MAPVEVTRGMIEREIAFRLSRTQGQLRKRLAALYEEMPKPQFLPWFAGLEVDPGGNLWVRRYSTGADPMNVWTVFDRAGRLLGDVQLPSKLFVFEIGDDYVLGAWKDDLDVESVRAYRIRR